MAQWFWRRWFFNFVNVYSLFRNYLPLKRAKPFIWTNLNSLHQRMLCAKFVWNCPSGSGEDDFLISSMYIRYFIIISPWKRAGRFIWTNLNPLHPRMLSAKFGWNTQVPRYLLLGEGGNFSTHALTLLGTKLKPYIGITLYMLP